MTKTEFETHVLVELRGIKAFMENAVTMDDVEKECTGQIETAVLNCKLEEKSAVKKLTMREMVFVGGLFSTAASPFILAIISSLQ